MYAVPKPTEDVAMADAEYVGQSVFQNDRIDARQKFLHDIFIHCCLFIEMPEDRILYDSALFTFRKQKQKRQHKKKTMVFL